MKFDLDVIQNDTLDITLGGKMYKVQLLDADTYVSASRNKERLIEGDTLDDGSKNIGAMRRWVCALAPELPPDKVKTLGLGPLRKILGVLDTFQGGVVGDDVGNVPEAGGNK